MHVCGTLETRIIELEVLIQYVYDNVVVGR